MSCELDIRNLCMGLPARLRCIKRFSTMRTSHPESVAEHSYYTTLYALLITEWCGANERHPNIVLASPTVVLRKALLHDMEECRTGDIPRPFKHSSTELEESFRASSETAMEQVAESITEDTAFASSLVTWWATAKNDTVEGRIVQFADFMSAMSYILQELWDRNLSFLETKDDIRDYSRTFNNERFDFIRPLVKELQALVEEFLNNEL